MEGAEIQTERCISIASIPRRLKTIKPSDTLKKSTLSTLSGRSSMRIWASNFQTRWHRDSPLIMERCLDSNLSHPHPRCFCKGMFIARISLEPTHLLLLLKDFPLLGVLMRSIGRMRIGLSRFILLSMCFGLSGRVRVKIGMLFINLFNKGNCLKT